MSWAVWRRGSGLPRQLAHLVAAVLAHEERRRLPARQRHGQVVEDRAPQSVIRREVVERLRAVDGDEIRLVPLHVLLHLGRHRRDAVRADGRAEVPDDDAFLQERRIEEVEALDVSDQLQRRLRERRAVQAAPPLASQVEHHLEGEGGLAGSWVARDDRNRAGREPAAENPIELGAAAAQTVDRLAFELHARSYDSTNETPLCRKRGSRSSCSTTTGPVNRVSSTPSSFASSRSERSAFVSAARRQLSGTLYS